MNHRLSIIGIALGIMILAGSIHAGELTSEQRVELGYVGFDTAQKAFLAQSEIQSKMAELELELKREGRLDNPVLTAESLQRIDTLVKDLSGHYRYFVESKVDFVRKAKHVLTPEQKQVLLLQIKPQKALLFGSVECIQPEVFELPIGLTPDQKQQLASLGAAMMQKEAELDRDVNRIRADLHAVLFSGHPTSAQAKPLIKELTALAEQELGNRTDYFIKAKKVLTFDQKRMLLFILGVD